MNPSDLFNKVITVDPTPLPRPKSAIEYDKQVNRRKLKKQMKEKAESKFYRIRKKK